MTGGSRRPARLPDSGAKDAPLDRAALRAHLVASRIAGDIATPREENLRNAGRMAEGLEHYAFGLAPLRPWTRAEVVAVMVERCGLVADPAYVRGPDTIDPDLTLDQLERWRKRLSLAAVRRERVLVATGHPTGVMAIHLQVVAALRAGGATVLLPETDWTWPWDDERGQSSWAPSRQSPTGRSRQSPTGRSRQSPTGRSEQSPTGRSRARHIRAINGVHVLASGGELLHTHSPEPMQALLGALSRPPDLVVGDHGWAGAAVEAGIEALAFADSNDPALFVAEHEGKPVLTVPLDDNVQPSLYDPLSAYVTHWPASEHDRATAQIA